MREVEALDRQFERLDIGSNVSQCEYNKLFFINTHSLETKNFAVYDNAEANKRGATQFLKNLQCKFCNQVFHKAFGLASHLESAHANEDLSKSKSKSVASAGGGGGRNNHGRPKAVTTGKAAGRKSARGGGGGKKKKKKRNPWETDEEEDSMAEDNEDEEEDDGVIVYDDEDELDLGEDDLYNDLPENDGPSVPYAPAGTAALWPNQPPSRKKPCKTGNKKQKTPPKKVIESFDAETAKVMAGFPELQPTVFLRDIYVYPEYFEYDHELPPKPLPSSGRPQPTTTIAAAANQSRNKPVTLKITSGKPRKPLSEVQILSDDECEEVESSRPAVMTSEDFWSQMELPGDKIDSVAVSDASSDDECDVNIVDWTSEEDGENEPPTPAVKSPPRAAAKKRAGKPHNSTIPNPYWSPPPPKKRPDAVNPPVTVMSPDRSYSPVKKRPAANPPLTVMSPDRSYPKKKPGYQETLSPLKVVNRTPSPTSRRKPGPGRRKPRAPRNSESDDTDIEVIMSPKAPKAKAGAKKATQRQLMESGLGSPEGGSVSSPLNTSAKSMVWIPPEVAREISQESGLEVSPMSKTKGRSLHPSIRTAVTSLPMDESGHNYDNDVITKNQTPATTTQLVKRKLFNAKASSLPKKKSRVSDLMGIQELSGGNEDIICID